MVVSLPHKLYYSIGEVAKAFGVNQSLIRFLEKEFKIISPKKDGSAGRKFTPDDVKKLQLIYHLVKEQGFTLEGARQRLKEDTQKTLSNYEIIAKLESVKQELLNIKKALN